MWVVGGKNLIARNLSLSVRTHNYTTISEGACIRYEQCMVPVADFDKRKGSRSPLSTKAFQTKQCWCGVHKCIEIRLTDAPRYHD
jgi:hypothetical protein